MKICAISLSVLCFVMLMYFVSFLFEIYQSKSEFEKEWRMTYWIWSCPRSDRISSKLCGRLISELVSSISSSAQRGSDALERYHRLKNSIEARLTLIGSTVIFHCHSSRNDLSTKNRCFSTICQRVKNWDDSRKRLLG